MKTQTITCDQRFADFEQSLGELNEIIDTIKMKGLKPELERHLHRSFEVTHEQALNTMASYFHQQGRPTYSGSRDITLDAFDEDLIDDGKGWLDMIICRIKATDVYTENVDASITDNIIKKYCSLFENFQKKMKEALEE